MVEHRKCYYFIKKFILNLMEAILLKQRQQKPGKQVLLKTNCCNNILQLIRLPVIEITAWLRRTGSWHIWKGIVSAEMYIILNICSSLFREKSGS